jgi:hypothetical protein
VIEIDDDEDDDIKLAAEAYKPAELDSDEERESC